MDIFFSPELKNPFETFIDQIGPVFLITLGSLAILVFLLIYNKRIKIYIRNRSQRQLSEEKKEIFQESDHLAKKLKEMKISENSS